jgi:YjbE family integral membrane protein
MSFIFDLAQVVVLDLSLAAENAIAVGMAVASLPPKQRKQATALGIAAATVLRIVLAIFAVQLLRVTGLLAAGGLLLLWVAWKMARELRSAYCSTHKCEKPPAKKFSEAIWQIVIADVSMSLDNVLGVAGIAREHIPTLVIGLILSVALMGTAATQIAKLTTRYPKIAWVGVAVVLYTALKMVYDGTQEVWPTIVALAQA